MNYGHINLFTFIFVQGMTEVDKFADVKEQERKQWLADLGTSINFKYSADNKLMICFCQKKK